jgi:cytidylate kinase
VITLVAISASYGAAGGRIGPALAERLGVPFLDRAIPAAVAARLAVAFDDAEAHDERLNASWLERMLRGFVGQDVTIPAWTPSTDETGEVFRRATEKVLYEQAQTGRGVILGRAASILLRNDDRVLRVRLDGAPENRVRQAMTLEGIDHDTAVDHRRRQDRAHATYARHFYGADIRDPSLYHLMLDSTAISIETCVELIATAATAGGDGPPGR